MNRLARLAEAVVASPLVWGAIASGGFFAAVQGGLLGSSFLQRYCAGHPVEYVETILFFIGLAVLAMKGMEVTAQRGRLNAALLGPPPAGGQDAAESPSLLTQLETRRDVSRGDYLYTRLRDGLLYVARRGSAESLDEHLKHLADLDAERAHAGSGLLRLIVWAIPILGFLGTVIGITLAIASLKISALEESMVDVTAGLAVAFDTTALALSLVTILMFLNFYVDRAETRLLAEVDRRVEAELLGRFPQVSTSPDGQVAAFRRVAAAMVESLDQIVRRQAEVLDKAVEGTRHVARLEETLNRNLAALAGAKNFEETVVSLAAAVNLLSARLGAAPAAAPVVHLEGHRRAGQAA